MERDGEGELQPIDQHVGWSSRGQRTPRAGLRAGPRVRTVWAMSAERAKVGPVQLILLGFDTTDRFRGDIARELLDLGGGATTPLLDAPFSHRRREEDLTKIALGALTPGRPANPVGR